MAFPADCGTFIDCSNQNITNDQLFRWLITTDSNGCPSIRGYIHEDRLTDYRNTALSNTAVSVYTGAAKLRSWNLINMGTDDVFLKFYDAASPTVGTTTPVKVLFVPKKATVVLENSGHAQEYFSTAISVACVTGIADSSTAAPTTALYVELGYVSA